jgi:hypothetical protein
MQIHHLADLHWQKPPVPSASLVHPDCRIILLQEFLGEFSMVVLRPSDLKTQPDHWMDEKGDRFWDKRQLSGRSETYPLNADLTWAWLKHFGG